MDRNQIAQLKTLIQRGNNKILNLLANYGRLQVLDENYRTRSNVVVSARELVLNEIEENASLHQHRSSLCWQHKKSIRPNFSTTFCR